MEWICVACGNAILDNYGMKINDKMWHQSCLKCADCSIILTEKCYSKHGLLLCSADYLRRYNKICRGCNKLLTETDIVQKVNFKDVLQFYHSKCFRCSACDRNLGLGSCYYISDDGRVLCPEDNASLLFDEDPNSDNDSTKDLSESPSPNNSQSVAHFSTTIETETKKQSDYEWLNSSNVDDLSLADSIEFGKLNYATDDNLSNHELGNDHSENDESHKQEMMLSPMSKQPDKLVTKKRGPRTSIKSHQLTILVNSFRESPKPSRNTRERLSAETGLTPRVIQVWFQNRRSKERRMSQAKTGNCRTPFNAYEHDLSRRIQEQNLSSPGNYTTETQMCPTLFSSTLSPICNQVQQHFSSNLFPTSPAWLSGTDTTRKYFEENKEGLFSNIVSSYYASTPQLSLSSDSLHCKPSSLQNDICCSQLQNITIADSAASQFPSYCSDTKREPEYWPAS